MKKKVSVVLVGAGGFGVSYVNELFADVAAGICEWVGVVDPRLEASPLCDKIRAAGIPEYASIEDFYAVRGADLCCLVVPTQFHTPYSVYAMKHGSHVLCEKPLSGDWRDGALLEKTAKECGRFIMTGFQWSYSDAILKLKRDILAGRYGRPKQLKTMILWPRHQSYFRRGTGWAGKKYAADGTPILDSVASNATAHYLHNMLFVLGETFDTAAQPVSLDAELFRANPIENFDTAVIRGQLENGAELLFIASHATKEESNPRFDYRFEGGHVTFDQDNGCSIVGTFADGTTVEYGNPFADNGLKIRYAIANVTAECDGGRVLVCTPKTATPHARTIYALRDAPIVTVPESQMTESLGGDDPQKIIDGMAASLSACYEGGCMLHELDNLDENLRTLLKPELGAAL